MYFVPGVWKFEVHSNVTYKCFINECTTLFDGYINHTTNTNCTIYYSSWKCHNALIWNYCQQFFLWLKKEIIFPFFMYLPCFLILYLTPSVTDFRWPTVFTGCLAAAYGSRAAVLGIYWGVSATAGGCGEAAWCVHGSAGECIIGPNAPSKELICCFPFFYYYYSSSSSITFICLIFFNCHANCYEAVVP